MNAETVAGARVADALEALRQEVARLGERVAALEATAGWLSSERRARLLVDMARACAQQRKAAAALQALEEAEQLAPELVRCHWLARETVLDLLRRQRCGAKSGRLDLAARMGLL